MSMLYIWNPWLSDDRTDLDLVLTRGDSDQVGNGSRRFITSILQTLGISSVPQRWSIQSYRCNFYSEYWEERGWESKWDFVWRFCAHFEEPTNSLALTRGYVGTDEIDDYSPLVESYKHPPFKCLVVGVFPTEKQAQSAAQQITDDKTVREARRGAAAPDPFIDIFRLAAGQFHLRAAVGEGEEGFFSSGYPDSIVSMLAASGGIIHAES